MARSASAVRIGEAERAAAQRALHDHLNAGRLQVNEYADRSARAAEAVTAPEIAALFVDLPAPRPKLPGSPFGGARRGLALAGLVVAVALVGLLAFAVGRSGQSGAAASPAVAAPAPTASPATAADPVAAPIGSTDPTPDGTSVGASATPLSDGATVRRTTGAETITLRPSYGVDLDDDTSSNWNVGVGCCGRDVGFASEASRLYLDNDYAVVTGPPQYATCSRETGYTNSPLERGSLENGETICVRTNDRRYALITIVGVSEQAFQFQATVWDPQISS
jgi:hypothetical protein